MVTFTSPGLKAANVAALEIQTHARGVSGELRVVRGWPALWAGEGAVFTRQLKLKGQEGSGVKHEMLDLMGEGVKVGDRGRGRGWGSTSVIC